MEIVAKEPSTPARKDNKKKIELKVGLPETQKFLPLWPISIKTEGKILQLLPHKDSLLFILSQPKLITIIDIKSGKLIATKQLYSTLNYSLIKNYMFIVKNSLCVGDSKGMIHVY